MLGEKGALGPKKPDPSDVAGALLRQEVRQMMRAMSTADRIQFALKETDQTVIDAIVHAPVATTGLPQDAHAAIVARETEKLHGPRLAELAEHEQALETAQAAMQVASDDLRRASRITEAA